MAAGCKLSGIAGCFAAGGKPATGSPVNYSRALLELRSRQSRCLTLPDTLCLLAHRVSFGYSRTLLELRNR